MPTTKSSRAVGMPLPLGYPTALDYPPPSFKLAAEAPSVLTTLDEYPSRALLAPINKRKREEAEQSSPGKRSKTASTGGSSASTPEAEPTVIDAPRRSTRHVVVPARYSPSPAPVKSTKTSPATTPPAETDTKPVSKPLKMKGSNPHDCHKSQKGTRYHVPQVRKPTKAGGKKRGGKSASKVELSPAPLPNSAKL